MTLPIQYSSSYMQQAMISVMAMQQVLNQITENAIATRPSNFSIGSIFSPYPMMSMPIFNMPCFMPNIASANNSNSAASSSSSSEASSSSSSAEATPSTSSSEVTSTIQNEAFWKNLGYNAEKGKKLARAGMNGSPHRFLGKCATYVKNAIQNAGLGKYIRGNGCDMETAYANNPNFKIISGKGIDTKKLPAGCILVFEAGKSGYHAKYGHTEIAMGNGTNVSDGITRNPREASWIMVPV